VGGHVPTTEYRESNYQKGNKMLLDSMTMLAILIALSTSIVVMTLAIRQNMELTRDNVNLRRGLKSEGVAGNVYDDPDIEEEDLWTTK